MRKKRQDYKRLKQNNSEEAKRKYKASKNEAKRAVAKARAKCSEKFYQDLDSREGRKRIFRVAKARNRVKRDTGDVAVIQDRDGIVLTEESEIRERWKEYFSQLLNTENEREELENIEKTEGPERCISSEEVEKALKQMSKAKAAGPTGVTSEMFRALGRDGIQWLTKLLNRLPEEETIPEDWRKSTMIPIYKAKCAPLWQLQRHQTTGTWPKGI